MSAARDQRLSRRGLEKRKACDLCHFKKIRCDGKQPECSHCVVYKANCTYTPHIKKRRKEATLTKRVSPPPEPTPLELQSTKAPPTANLDLSSAKAPPEGAKAIHAERKLWLPPLSEYFLIIDDYFANYNSVVPLFGQRAFRLHLQKWDTDPSLHDAVTWAAINVVMALAVQQRATELSLPLPFSLEKCIANAQSVVSELISHSADLRAVQVLVGLIILFQGTESLRPSSVLVATAVKLAHRLRLHFRPEPGQWDDETTTERANVFWILYTLDRDINLKVMEPYLLQEHDIDLDLPGSFEDSNFSGLLQHSDGQTWFNWFQARVHLARVEGNIYDYLYSIRAGRRSNEEKEITARRLREALGVWKQSIPEEFQYDHLPGTLPPFAVRHLLILHFAYFQELFKAHRVFSHDPDWIRRLSDYSNRYAIKDTAFEKLPSPLPENWGDLVESSRACIKVFRLADQADMAIRWLTGCTYISATIILIANNLTFSEHEIHSQFQGDVQLIEEGLAYLQKLCTVHDNDRMRSLHSACAELHRRAIMSATRFWLAKTQDPSAPSWMADVSMGWLDAEAGKAARQPIVNLVDAFSGAAMKPFEMRNHWTRLIDLDKIDAFPVSSALIEPGLSMENLF